MRNSSSSSNNNRRPTSRERSGKDSGRERNFGQTEFRGHRNSYSERDSDKDRSGFREKRSFNSRPARKFNEENDGFREKRSFNSRPARKFNEENDGFRERRSFNSRPARKFNEENDGFRERRSFNSRPARRFNEENDGFRERRSFNSRPARRFKEENDGFRERRSFNSQSSLKKSGYIRLNKFIANAGVCSRREADTMITSGVITVNGEVCTTLGTMVGPDDKVVFGGQRLFAEKKVYLLMNKPKGYITTMDDPDERKTVMDLLKGACPERIYPVGRLDRNTTGVLLFTNDGEIAKKLTHPSHGARKMYHVTLDKALTKNDMRAIAEGIELEDGVIFVDEISYVENASHKEVGLQIHSGRNRIVRRIFEHLGYSVQKLDRVLFAELTKKNLARGEWRFLDEQEIKFLKMNA